MKEEKRLLGNERGESIDSIRVIEKNQMPKIGIEIREFERGNQVKCRENGEWYVVSKSH